MENHHLFIGKSTVNGPCSMAYLLWASPAWKATMQHQDLDAACWGSTCMVIFWIIYIYIYIYIYISADPGRQQGGARQGIEVVKTKTTTSNKQQATTNNQTNNQQPTTNTQQPITNDRPRPTHNNNNNSNSNSNSNSTSTSSCSSSNSNSNSSNNGDPLAGDLSGSPSHVLRFIDSGFFVLPVGGPSRSLLEVREASWVGLPAEQKRERLQRHGDLLPARSTWHFLGCPRRMQHFSIFF